MKSKDKERLAEASAALDAKRAEAKPAWAKLEAAKATAIAAGAGALSEDSPEFQALNEAGRVYDDIRDEVSRMEAQFTQLASLVGGEEPQAARLPGDSRPELVKPRDAAEAFDRNVDAFMEEFKAWAAQMGEAALSNPKGKIGTSPSMKLIDRADFRAATTLTTAYPSINTRRPQIVPLIKESLSLLDVIPMVPVDHETVEYVYEKTFTHDTAVEKAEAAAAGEGTIELDVASVACKWIPFTIPATRQILSDEPRMRAFIQDRLIYGVRDRLMNQLYNGNATGQNLRGITYWSGILTQDMGTNTVADVVHKAKTKIRVQCKGMYEPQVLLMHPNDEERLVLAKDDNLNYLFGGPQREGITCWGMVPISHVAITEGAPIVADIRACEAYIREDVSLQVTDSHDDHFTKGIIDFLASGRFGFAILEAKAFCAISDFDS